MTKEDLIRRITNYSSKVVTRETVESIVYAIEKIPKNQTRSRQKTILFPPSQKKV